MKEIRANADQILERHYIKHQNRRKRKAILDYQKNGWILTLKGMPDFLATKVFSQFRAVWVPENGALTAEQKRLQGIFRAQGFDVRTVNLDAPFCAPEGSKEG